MTLLNSCYGERDKLYEAAFRKADELGWEGEEQFMGELIEIVDAVLDAKEDRDQLR